MSALLLRRSPTLWQSRLRGGFCRVSTPLVRSIGSSPVLSRRHKAVPQDATPDHAKKNFQLVIVGTGWAGYLMYSQCKTHITDIEKVVGRSVDLVVISKRNHFLYTPLLASTTVGTLEFRSIAEPLRDTMFRHEDDFHYADVNAIDPIAKSLSCQSTISQRQFAVHYDLLVLACGARPMTFGIEGVEKHAFFLKEIADAQRIRKRILENFEEATQPNVSDEEKKRLLHFVVVGGGPTGIEFCAELYDFVLQDLRYLYPQTSKYLAVSLVDSGPILTGFEAYLREFAMKKIEARPNMRLIKKNCVDVQSDAVVVQGGERIPCGLCVWTAGVGPNDLTKQLNFAKSKRGNLLTNAYCQVLGVPEVETTPLVEQLPLKSNIFSIGDCAEIQDYVLPATAQKAQGQAEYLTSLLRNENLDKSGKLLPYVFQSRGMMAYLGSYEGLLQLPKANQSTAARMLAGWTAWFIWRSAYLTKLGSWRLRMQVPIDWLKALIVGRDVSRF